MNVLWSVQTDPNLDVMTREKATPSLINQCAVGLKAVGDVYTQRIVSLSQAKGVFVERSWEHEWLASVPDDGNGIGQLCLSEQPLKDSFKSVLGDPFGRGAL